MVAVALGDLRLLVLLALLHRDHLRGAGLAADGVSDPGERAGAGALLVEPGHGALDEVVVIALEGHGLQLLSRQLGAFAVSGVVDGRGEARYMPSSDGYP